MTIATRIDSTITGTITQTTLANGIKTAMSNAGFGNSFEDYISGSDRIITYQHINDASKTYGKVYLAIFVSTTLTVSTRVIATRDPVTAIGTGGSTLTTSSAFASSGNISISAFNAGSEFRFIQLVQGSIVFPIGLIIPIIRPTWWDLNNYPYGFAPTGSGLLTWRASSINPFSNDALIAQVGQTQLGTANPVSGRRDMSSGILFFSSANNGIACKTSDDLAAVAGSGLNRYDLLQPQGTTQQYCVLNPAAGGLAVRTA